MEEHRIMLGCDACGQKYQMGPHRYDGQYIRAYELGICRACYAANWDGWGPLHEPKIIAHLEHHGIPIPSRNAKGWIPRGD